MTALDLSAHTTVKLPAFQVHQAIYRLGKKFKLNMNSYALLGLFVHRIRNDDGLINLLETRWDSRAAWCRFLGIEDDETGKKTITKAFGELKSKGLIEFWKDETGRTLRRLTRKAVDVVKSLLSFQASPPRLVRPSEITGETTVPESEESDEKDLPGSGEHVDLGLPGFGNTTPPIRVPEVNKGSEKEKLNTPPASQEVDFEGKSFSPPSKPKAKLMTMKGLVGIVRAYHHQFENIQTVEGYVKEMLRAGYEIPHIIRATEIRKEGFETTGVKYFQTNPFVLDEWKRLCEMARRETT